MLAMTAVVVDYMFKICFQLSIFYRWAPKRRGARGNFFPTLPLDGPGCFNNVLINALKN